MTHHWQDRARRAENRCRHLEGQLAGKQTEIDALKYRLEKAEEALRKATTKPKADRRAVLPFPLPCCSGPEPMGAA
jgi:predicted  nucleic acid-binding Zn-ribbon protein